MANHSVVVYRNQPNNVRFEDDDWLRYVPIRQPWTMCVQDRIPAGAAGVLVNQTHIFNDLFLVINAQEKQVFDAIDGRRTIAEISGALNAEPARQFFEKLWFYDQVVFDTSNSRRSN